MGFKFNSKAFGFSQVNAMALGRAAKLVYRDFTKNASDDESFQYWSREWGFDGGENQFFDFKGAQAFIHHDDEKIILAFRGTEPDQLEDWITDAKCRKTIGPCGDVHRGFSQSLNRIWDDMEGVLETIREDGKGRRTLWITGHSLGAALATLAAARLRFRESSETINGVYTFGQPRTGSENFADNYNAVLKAKTFRFVNNNDVVTRVPPSLLNYGHVGQLVYFDGDRERYFDSDLSWWSRFWDGFTSRLESFAHLDPADGITDHSMNEYLKGLEHNN